MKVLAGKRATVSPYISSISEGMDGSSSPKDLETLLQLTNLYFTNNRRDYDAFQSWYNRMESRIKSQEGTPNKVFSDSLNATMYQHNPEYTAITLNELSDINYDRIMDIYSERFANAGDFTLVFVGNVDENELNPLVEKYIASLPAKGKKEKYNESYMARIAEGNIENRFTIPMSTPKVTVFNIYTVDMKYNIENLLTSNALFQVMRSVYTRTIREEEGGTYGVSTYADVRQVPMDECVFIYQFDTSEDKVAKLEQRAYDEFLNVADNGPEKEDFDKVKEFMLKNYDQQIKENGYWLEVIKSKEFFNTDIHSDYLQAINNLTPKMVQDMAKLIITSGNRIQLVSTGIQQ